MDNLRNISNIIYVILLYEVALTKQFLQLVTLGLFIRKLTNYDTGRITIIFRDWKNSHLLNVLLLNGFNPMRHHRLTQEVVMNLIAAISIHRT